MNTVALSFLSDELPENWEEELEREKTTRHQHQIYVENAIKRQDVGRQARRRPEEKVSITTDKRAAVALRNISFLLPRILDCIENFADQDLLSSDLRSARSELGMFVRILERFQLPVQQPLTACRVVANLAVVHQV